MAEERETAVSTANQDATSLLGDRSELDTKGTEDGQTRKRNAFSELMSPKGKRQTTTTTTSSLLASSSPSKTQHHFYVKHGHNGQDNIRAGLLPYTTQPEKYPSNVVLRVTEHTVLIRDLFPKATVHLLLLPRSPAHRSLHPHDAFADIAFLDQIKSEASSAVQLAASELSRLLSSFSRSQQARNAALDSLEPIESSSETTDLPPDGRDFTVDFKVGIHAHPSMSHLHIHVISRDMHSDRLKHRKHYNSFTTPFFIPLADYPLADDDPRRDTAYQNANLKRDYVCWRCGKGYANRFQELKRHLDDEFDEWRRE